MNTFLVKNQTFLGDLINIRQESMECEQFTVKELIANNIEFLVGKINGVNINNDNLPVDSERQIYLAWSDFIEKKSIVMVDKVKMESLESIIDISEVNEIVFKAVRSAVL